MVIQSNLEAEAEVVNLSLVPKECLEAEPFNLHIVGVLAASFNIQACVYLVTQPQ